MNFPIRKISKKIAKLLYIRIEFIPAVVHPSAYLYSNEIPIQKF